MTYPHREKTLPGAVVLGFRAVRPRTFDSHLLSPYERERPVGLDMPYPDSDGFLESSTSSHLHCLPFNYADRDSESHSTADS